MLKLSWKSLLVSPAVVGAALMAGNAQAAPDNAQVLDQLDNYASEGLATQLDQVTSVSELRDVQPTEWAYEALKSLVERYGCIVGYPDRTFRGNRALSRWEFAAGLNACMNVMERLIQENVAVLREDIDKLKRLMQEFEAELAALGARVDNLEARVSFLEDHQFSTTTKLTGEVIFQFAGAGGESLTADQFVFQDRVRLQFDTSFSGEDLLVTRLAAGSAEAFYDTTGAPAPALTTNADLNPGGNDVFVDWLAYYVPVDISSNIRLNSYIAAFGGIWPDFVPTLAPYFDDYTGGKGAISEFSARNPIYNIGGGAGIGTNLSLGFLESFVGPSSLSIGYLAGNGNSPTAGNGLFNGNYAALAQIDTTIADSVNLGFTYINAYSDAASPIFGFGAGGWNGVTGTTASNLVGFNKQSNSYGLQGSWKIADWASLSAFGSYTNVTQIGIDNRDIWTYGGGLAFPDLGKEGNLLGVFAGVQPYLAGGSTTSAGYARAYNPVQVEVFYKYQLTDNLSLTPGIIWISKPEQDVNSKNAVVGTLRGTFTF
ncbi:MAG: hypothetical protein RLZZ568_1205 [Cyanobacteriota bacterium]|jgi:hypothetical protein